MRTTFALENLTNKGQRKKVGNLAQPFLSECRLLWLPHFFKPAFVMTLVTGKELVFRTQLSALISFLGKDVISYP
jgi:hypothetical protein